MEAEGHPTLAPGMTRVCHADETLVLTDNEGHEFAVEGREAESTMTFLKAFDMYFTAKESNAQGIALDALWWEVKQKFNEMPMRVQKQLPSFSQGGVILRDHQH